MTFNIKYLIAIITLLVIIVSTSAFFLLKNIEKTTREETGKSLKTLLDVTNRALTLWADNRERDILSMVQHEEIIELTNELLALPRDKQSLITSPLQEHVRSLVKDDLNRFNDLGIFIIAPDFINLSSMRNKNIGDTSLIWKQREGVLEEVFEGKVKIVLPLYSDVNLDKNGISSVKAPTMFIAAPIMITIK